MLRRLSVFAGGWTLEAAEAVCAGPGCAGPAVPSWSTSRWWSPTKPERQARYRLLETIRQYARDKLIEAGAAKPPPCATAISTTSCSLTEQARLGLRGLQAIEWIDRIDPEEGNIRAAAEWGQEKRPEAVLRMVGNLILSWPIRLDRREHFSAVSDLIQRLDELPSSDDQPIRQYRDSLKAEGHSFVGLYALFIGDNQKAREYFTRAVALVRNVDDPVMLAWMLCFLTIACEFTGDIPAARSAAMECNTVLNQFAEHDPLRVTFTLMISLRTWVDSVDEKQAPWEHYRKQVDRMLNEANPLLVVPAIISVGIAARSAGDYGSARLWYEKGVALARRLKTRKWVAVMSSELAHVCRITGDWQQAEAAL